MTFKKISPYLFIAPHLIIFCIFFLIPAVFGIFISFTNWNIVGTPTFVGLDNFRELLFSAESTFSIQFQRGMRNTIMFAIFSVPFCVIFPLLFASALNTKPVGTSFFQAIFYMPSLFAITAVILIWEHLFSRTHGPINNILGIDVFWAGTQPWAWMAIVIVTIWWTIGANLLIYRAAISGVPGEYYEAASIDGASAFQKFFYITLPSIKNQILYTVILTTIAQLNIFGQPLMLTGGGPNFSTDMLLMVIARNAFGAGPSIAGISSAMAVMLGLVIMTISIVQYKLLQKD